VVLVHSAASGVGRMLTQLVTGRGGRVIATVSRAHKARPATEAGAWQVLVRDETEDLGAAIRDLTSGGGVDVLIDRTYPLHDAAEAHRDIESQKTVGKLLLLP